MIVFADRMNMRIHTPGVQGVIPELSEFGVCRVVLAPMGPVPGSDVARGPNPVRGTAARHRCAAPDRASAAGFMIGKTFRLAES
jgi:hypothetical protein